MLDTGAGRLTPWTQQQAPSPALPKKKSEYDWAVSGTYPNLDELYNKCVWNTFNLLKPRAKCTGHTDLLVTGQHAARATHTSPC